MTRAPDPKLFKPIAYMIDLRDGPRQVNGYAFETPGWPEWHACVRYGNRYGDDCFHDWIVDHYETGLALSGAGVLKRPEDAPKAMAKLLEEKGRDAVAKRLGMISA